MSAKILTVDDSKAVRIIVKKTFKPYDVEICEAEDGKKGLEAAKRENPDLILLDVTMPVMDGVEMLAQLKEDPSTKNIPVVMLTAEGSKQIVLKIAQIGVRDYIVKPFQEDTVLDKVGKIITLEKKSIVAEMPKTGKDPCTILVVEDKDNIVEQIKSGITNASWNVHSVPSYEEATKFCSTTPPHVAIVKLTLPDDEAYKFFSEARGSAAMKNSLLMGMTLKTDEESMNKARSQGCKHFVTKPINAAGLEDQLFSALKLDPSDKYFKQEGNSLCVTMPAEASNEFTQFLEGALKSKINDAVEEGLASAVFDLQSLAELNIELMRILTDAAGSCSTLGLHCAFVATSELAEHCTTTYEECKSWAFHSSKDDAMAAPA